MVYDSKEPIGGRRDDALFALLMALLANFNRRRGSRPLQAAQFLVDWWSERSREQDPEAMLRFAASLTEALGGTVAPSVEQALAEGFVDGDRDGVGTAPR